MKRILISISFILILASGKPAYAQDVIYAGIPSDQFNFYASSQHNSNWCWAASIQMILNYYGVNITQEQIVRRSYGMDPYGNLPNWTGSFEVITANLNNWGIDNAGIAYSVAATVYGGAPTPFYLVDELSNGRPLLIGYKSSATTGHAVVITACSYIPSFNGPMIQTIVVRDPWPSDENIANLGRVEYNGFDLANVIMAHWYVRVMY